MDTNLRYLYNKAIIAYLSEQVEKYKDLRFFQIVSNSIPLEYIKDNESNIIGIKDFFYEESETTWERITSKE